MITFLFGFFTGTLLAWSSVSLWWLLLAPKAKPARGRVLDVPGGQLLINEAESANRLRDAWARAGR